MFGKFVEQRSGDLERGYQRDIIGSSITVRMEKETSPTAGEKEKT